MLLVCYFGNSKELQLGNFSVKGKERGVNGGKKNDKSIYMVKKTGKDLGICRVEQGVACSFPDVRYQQKWLNGEITF